MVEEAERRQAEAERLRQEVMQAREAEKDAKNKLIGREIRLFSYTVNFNFLYILCRVG